MSLGLDSSKIDLINEINSSVKGLAIFTTETMQTSTLPAYTVPELTVEQVGDILQALGQGMAVIVFDSDGEYVVTESDAAISEIRFAWCGLYLGYYIDDDTVIAVYDRIGSGRSVGTYTVSTSGWSALSTPIAPYTHSASILLSTTPTSSTTIVRLINDNLANFMQYGFQIYSVSGNVVTIYSIGAPTTSISFKIALED